jgi:hypothetical protein
MVYQKILLFLRSKIAGCFSDASDHQHSEEATENNSHLIIVTSYRKLSVSVSVLVSVKIFNKNH